MKKTVALIMAAGKGTRMRANKNKQFLDIKGKPILYYTLKKFEDNKNIDEIILIISENEIEYCREEIVKKNKFNKVVNIVSGGRERQDSVINGLEALEKCDVVLIHDGARPFVSHRIINEGIEYAKQYGASACGVNPKDTMKVRDNEGFSKETLNRDIVYNVQTPQCFKYDLILDSHKKVREDKIIVTDDTMVVEYCGHKVYLYEGSYDNIKLTTPEDLLIAEKILEKNIE